MPSAAAAAPHSLTQPSVVAGNSTQPSPSVDAAARQTIEDLKRENEQVREIKMNGQAVRLAVSSHSHFSFFRHASCFFSLPQKDKLIKQLQLQTPQQAVTLATASPVVSPWPAHCSVVGLLSARLCCVPCLGFRLACPL